MSDMKWFWAIFGCVFIFGGILTGGILSALMGVGILLYMIFSKEFNTFGKGD